MKNKLSVTIICKNEARRIRRCLESVSWADEIVIVDSGSTDETLEIAKEFTDKIFKNTEWPGFGLQRRIAEDNASNDWVLAIDSDEVLSPELQEEIKYTLDNAQQNEVYRLNRMTHFCGKFIKHSGWYPDRIVRLYNKKSYRYNDALVHESVDCKSAKVIDLKSVLYHFTIDTLEKYIDKRNRYADAWAQRQFEKGRRASTLQIVIRPLFAFFRHYILRLGVLDGYHGYMIAVIQMQYTFNKYNFLKFKCSGSQV
ncbi:MAG: glycosyltransferase family 2 protein [Gammaproteobacteria bacterium]|nr:glycosyltransferase family 2 protein [Gammaproteobacteria bacterium]